MSPEVQVLALLAMLAEQTGEKVSQARSDFYAERLIPLGAGRVVEALKRMMDGAKRFPTVNEIKAELGEAPQTAEDKGREVADRIWVSLTRGWASSLSPAVQAERDTFVGPIGVEVVRQMGGWQRLGEVCMEDEETTRKAQWRETARIIAQKGGLGAAPQHERLAPAMQETLKIASRSFVDLSQPKENE
jgi:hypothetical protein